jgi:hypothetical protein
MSSAHGLQGARAPFRSVVLRTDALRAPAALRLLNLRELLKLALRGVQPKPWS